MNRSGFTVKLPTRCSSIRSFMSALTTSSKSRFDLGISAAKSCHSFFNVEKNQLRPVSAIQIHYTEAGGITGHIMLLCMLLMYTTAHRMIRQQSFETFWYTHHLFIPFLLGLYTHATGCFVRDTPNPYSPFAGSDFWDHCIGYEGWRWELWGGGIYLIERIYREIRSRRATEIVRVIRHPYGKHLSSLGHRTLLTYHRSNGDSV
jgi:Ferric reductase like transmembrane component